MHLRLRDTGPHDVSYASAALPGVVCCVRDRFFFVGGNGHREFNRVAVGLFVLNRTGSDIPVRRSVEVFDNPNVYRFLLVVAQLDLERFGGRPVVAVDDVVATAALAREIKSVAGVDTHGLVVRGVVDRIFAGEFDLAIVVAAIKAHPAFRQRHAQMVRIRIAELAHHPNLRIRFRAVGVIVANVVPVPAVVAVAVDLHAVINVDLLGDHPRRCNEFHLLGFAVAQRGACVRACRGGTRRKFSR